MADYIVFTTGQENQNYSLGKLAKNLKRQFSEEKMLMVKINMASHTNFQNMKYKLK